MRLPFQGRLFPRLLSRICRYGYLTLRPAVTLFFHFEGLLAYEAKLHLRGCAGVDGVPLEAGSLKVLYSIHFPVGGANLGQLLGDGVPKGLQPASLLPVAQERLLEGVAGLWKIDPVLRGWEGIYLREVTTGDHPPADSRKQHGVAACRQFRVRFQDRALEVLDSALLAVERVDLY